MQTGSSHFIAASSYHTRFTPKLQSQSVVIGYSDWSIQQTAVKRPMSALELKPTAQLGPSVDRTAAISGGKLKVLIPTSHKENSKHVDEMIGFQETNAVAHGIKSNV